MCICQEVLQTKYALVDHWERGHFDISCEHKICEWLAWKDGFYRLYCACCEEYLEQESCVVKSGLFKREVKL